MLQQHRVLGSGVRPRTFTARVSRGSLQVHNARTRANKEEVVEQLKGKLESSVAVYGLRFKGLSVDTVARFRQGLPEATSMMVTKNSLMRAASAAVPGWSALGDKGCTGDNAWVFVGEEDIPAATKHFNKFAADLEKEAKAALPKGADASTLKPPTALSCAVMDGKYLSPAEFKRCENLPTKKEVLATIARLIKQPAQKLAVGIKAVPRKLAYGVKALADLDDDKSKVVGDVAKPSAA